MNVQMVGGPDDGTWFGVGANQSWLSVPVYIDTDWKSGSKHFSIPSFKVLTFSIHVDKDDSTKGTVYWSERIYGKENL